MNLNMEMTKYKLGDIATIYDGPHATPKRTDNGPVYLGIDAITEDCKINPNEFTFLSEEDYKIWTKRVVPQFKDIVFSYEATLGRYAIIPENFYGCLGRRLGIIRVKSDAVDYKWLYYFFQSPQWKCYIKNHIIKGSTVNRISVDEMPGYEIPACGIADQKKIASVLSALDDKIALNKKMNQKLEAMAKRLYDYWFVQYDFPDKNGHPYKTTGGKMEYNPTLKREIPTGWEVKTIGDYLKIGNGRDHSKLADGSYPVYGSGGIMRYVAEYLHDGETVLFPRKGTLNNVMYRNEPLWTVDTMFYTSVLVPHSALFVFYSAKMFDFERLNTGTGVPSMTSDIIKKLPIISPDKHTLEQFDKTVAKLYNQIHHNEKEISRLSEQRDKLLPLLMNGQVIVE